MSPNEKQTTITQIRKLLAVIHSFKQPADVVKDAKQKLANHVDALKENGMDEVEIAQAVLQN